MADSPESEAMRGVNEYWRELTQAEIASGVHRESAAIWALVGQLQFDYVRSRGLKPAHRLLDVGCGPLRGGLHFIRYLDPENYYGFDINRSRIFAGEMELRDAGLASRNPHLAVIGDFDATRFGVSFDAVIAISLFTHLFANHILRCMKEVARVLAPAGVFYATYFEAPESGYLLDLCHPGRIVSHYDSDPFHYSVEDLAQIASGAGLVTHPIGFWSHPRGQAMVEFTPRPVLA